VRKRALVPLCCVALLLAGLLAASASSGIQATSQVADRSRTPVLSWQHASSGGSSSTGISTSSVLPLARSVVRGTDDSSDPTYTTDVTVDSDGNIYVTGYTKSTDLDITSGSYATTPPAADKYNIFVCKYSSSFQIVWGTYFGGDQNDYATAIEVNSSGYVYFAGYTESDAATFNTSVAAPYQAARVGSFDAFVAILDPDGHDLVYNSYIGGTLNDRAWDLAVDRWNRAWIVGDTASNADFKAGASGPGTDLQGTFGGGTLDGFIWCLDPWKGGYYASFVAGDEEDSCRSLVLANQTDRDQVEVGLAVLTEASTDLLTHATGYDTTIDGTDGSWYLQEHRVESAVGFLNYGTYVGTDLSLSDDEPYYFPVIDFDNSTGLYAVAGSVLGTSWPTTVRAEQKSAGGGTDAYLAYFRMTGGGSSDLRGATLWGGSAAEHVFGVSYDVLGRVAVVGSTRSDDLQAVGPRAEQKSDGTYREGLFARFTAPSGDLGDVYCNYSTAWGASGRLWTEARGLAMDERYDHPVVAGTTGPADVLVREMVAARVALPHNPFFAAVSDSISDVDGAGDTLRLVAEYSIPSAYSDLLGAVYETSSLTLTLNDSSTTTALGRRYNESAFYEVEVRINSSDLEPGDIIGYEFEATSLDGGSAVAYSGLLNLTSTEEEEEGDGERPGGLEGLLSLLEDYQWYLLSAAIVVGSLLSTRTYAPRRSDSETRAKSLRVRFSWLPTAVVLVVGALALGIPAYLGTSPFDLLIVGMVVGAGAVWSLLMIRYPDNRFGFTAGLAVVTLLLTVWSIYTGVYWAWPLAFGIVCAGSVLYVLRGKIPRIDIKVGNITVAMIIQIVGAVLALVVLLLPLLLPGVGNTSLANLLAGGI